eukprot:352022-Chlamydomonas_euryale.AAC.4
MRHAPCTAACHALPCATRGHAPCAAMRHAPCTAACHALPCATRCHAPCAAMRHPHALPHAMRCHAPCPMHCRMPCAATRHAPCAASSPAAPPPSTPPHPRHHAPRVQVHPGSARLLSNLRLEVAHAIVPRPSVAMRIRVPARQAGRCRCRSSDAQRLFLMRF